MADSSAEQKKRRFGGSSKADKPAKGPGRFSQIKQVYQMTAKADPWLPWMLAGVFLAIVAVCLLIGWVWGGGRTLQLIYMAVIGIPLGILAVTLLLGQRAKKAAYAQIDGMPGASVASLGELRRGWTYEREPVATEAVGKVRGMRDMGNAAMVFRAIGRPGVVLVAEGPRAAATRLATAERKRVARVVGEKVPVEILRVGTDDDAVPARQLARRINKMKPVLSKEEAAVVSSRLKSLGNARPPIPAGMDPRNARRPSRKSMRGR